MSWSMGCVMNRCMVHWEGVCGCMVHWEVVCGCMVHWEVVCGCMMDGVVVNWVEWVGVFMAFVTDDLAWVFWVGVVGVSGGSWGTHHVHFNELDVSMGIIPGLVSIVAALVLADILVQVGQGLSIELAT